jgi:ATP-binding protein involved in chromosome partitioning
VIDPRTAVVARRLEGVRRVVAVCSAKGGVGKTFCTAAAGLRLAAAGATVGILDLDLQGATVHVFLGVAPRFPEEREGILPLPVSDRLCLMSAAAFTGERPLPLRGAAVSDALLELLAVTRWGELDVLLIDLPPGIGEVVMELARLVPRLAALVVTTPSLVSVKVVERMLAALADMKVPVAGLVASMARGDAGPAHELASRAGVLFAGEVPWDDAVEAAVGIPAALAATAAADGLAAALTIAGIPGGGHP